MDVKQELLNTLKKILKDLGFEDIEAKVGYSEPKHGNYSSNVALVLGQKLKKSPIELASKIADEFNKKNLEFLEKVEVVSPGFINFWLSEDYLLKKVLEVLEKKDGFGKAQKLSGHKIMVEFAHPNTHKEFHIGHLRNITIGESICRLLQTQGAEIFRANYQGDIGPHVAKAIWGIQNSALRLRSGQEFKIQNDLPLSKKIELLAKAYTVGSKAYEEDERVKKEVQEVNKKIYQKDPSILEIWEKTRQWSLDYFESIYKRVGSYFDRLFFESEVYEKGKEIVENHVQDGIFIKDQGAIIFNGEEYGLHKRVFITGEGNATYEGKEMGLAFLEYSVFPFDLNVHVVAHEQAGYFKVVFKALELIDKKFKDRQKHLSYGMVELKEGKMSSRMGNIITAEWILDEAKKRIAKAFAEMDSKTAEIVAVGAVKYSLLKFSVAANVSFSFDESISLEGNSGPYLQYTFARTHSVLTKSQITNSKFQMVRQAHHPEQSRRINSKSQITNSKLEPEEEVLLRLIQRFPEVVEEAADNYAPNLLCNYLFDLAQKFNLFYQKHKVIGSENEEFRLALTAAVGQIIKNGLYLLGIEAPDRM